MAKVSAPAGASTTPLRGVSAEAFSRCGWWLGLIGLMAKILRLRGHKKRWSGQPDRPQQGVAIDRETGDKAHFRENANFHLAHRPAVLAPAEDLLDPLAQPLAGEVAGIARGAPIACRASRAAVS